MKRSETRKAMGHQDLSREWMHEEAMRLPRGEQRRITIRALKCVDSWDVAGSMRAFNMVDARDDKTYRILVCDTGVAVLCFGLEAVDSKLEGHYDRVDDLPDWVKERLAVLMVLDAKPPTAEIDGIGRRISEKVFWVYAPDA